MSFKICEFKKDTLGSKSVWRVVSSIDNSDIEFSYEAGWFGDTNLNEPGLGFADNKTPLVLLIGVGFFKDEYRK